ncbi:uncharacterized protein LOC136024741 isoform X1 [Artemia franciscana]|uniref:uncharacterized protein LOC136024741 isoform X1 n=1 Tax=Artemia franciscana TaxID=6661 RepID=UPI0032DA07A7
MDMFRNIKWTSGGSSIENKVEDEKMIDYVCWSFLLINVIGIADFLIVRDEKITRHLVSVSLKLFWTNITLVLFWGITSIITGIVIQVQYLHSQFLISDYLPAAVTMSTSKFLSYFGLLPIPILVAAFYIFKFVIQLLSFNPDISVWEVLLLCARPVSVETAERLVARRGDDTDEQHIETLPNLWLTPSLPNDYIKYLPVWKHRGWKRRQRRRSGPPSISSMTKLGLIARKIFRWLCGRFHIENIYEGNFLTHHPQWIIPDSSCAICLEEYRPKVLLCGLSCGHHYHRDCISSWLNREQHFCPICRSPAYTT